MVMTGSHHHPIQYFSLPRTQQKNKIETHSDCQEGGRCCTEFGHSLCCQYFSGLFRPFGCPLEALVQSPVAAGTLASLRGGTSGRSAWKGQENGQKRKTSGQTSGHAWKVPQSPEEPWCFSLELAHTYAWPQLTAHTLTTTCACCLSVCNNLTSPPEAQLAQGLFCAPIGSFGPVDGFHYPIAQIHKLLSLVQAGGGLNALKILWLCTCNLSAA
jgi:hypothetical protein